MGERYTKRTGSHLTNMKRDVIVLHLEEHFRGILSSMYKKETPGTGSPEFSVYSDEELYNGLVRLAVDLLQVSDRNDGEKKFYFLSMDYPVGPMLVMNLINLGIHDQVKEILQKNGRDLRTIAACEKEMRSGLPGSSMFGIALLEGAAAKSLPGEGLFLRDCQCDFRKENGGPGKQGPSDWERKCDVFSFVARIGKKRIRSDIYDVELPGYLTGINRIRLFTPHGGDDSIARKGASYLCLARQYFLACNAAQLILHKLHGQHYDLHRMDEHVVIEILDARSAMIIPELIREIVEAKAFSAEEAIKVVSRACVFSGQAPNAGEDKWNGQELHQLNSSLWTLMRRLDRHIRKTDPQEKLLDENGDVEVTALIGVCCRIPETCAAVNIRRSLHAADPELAAYLEDLTGLDLCREPWRLPSAADFSNDRKVLRHLRQMKEEKKRALLDRMDTAAGGNKGKNDRPVKLSEKAVFDMQLAPVSSEARQLLNVLDIIRRILDVRNGKTPAQQAVFFFSSSVVPGDRRGRDVLKVLEALRKVLAGDAKAGKYYRICLLPDVNAAGMMRLLPACDVYESLAEDPGPRNTSGILEAAAAGALAAASSGGVHSLLRNASGTDAVRLFGPEPGNSFAGMNKSAEKILSSSGETAETVGFLISPEMMKNGSPAALKRLYGELVSEDPDGVLADFRVYRRAREKQFEACGKPFVSGRMMLHNMAAAARLHAEDAAEMMNDTYWRI